jgi:2-polyprenyl-6-methoxyphenol hydroxylase-like FAD-dependent oxidoreductase
MDYQGTVNTFRGALRARELLQVRKIARLQDADDHCAIVFEDGAVLRARLAVMATGGSSLARTSLGLSAGRKGALTSTSFGFHAEPTGVDGFRFDAFNTIPDRFINGLHYGTFFPVGGRMRVNIFTCWHPSGPEGKAFRADPAAAMGDLFPHLIRHSGPFRISGKVQVFTTRYYRQRSEHLKSVILVGDEFQSVSPATGMGISKCLTDVQAATGMLAALRDDPAVPLDVSAYFRNPAKRRVDEDARRRWEWANESATSRSLRTRLKKLKRALSARRSLPGPPITDAVTDNV